MSDNVTLPGNGTVVKTDDIGGAQVQIIKILLGSDNADGGLISSGNPMPVSFSATPLDVLTDESGSFTYVGKAVPGSDAADPVWLIFRLDESASPDLAVRYADGGSVFNKVWNARATYSY